MRCIRQNVTAVILLASVSCSNADEDRTTKSNLGNDLPTMPQWRDEQAYANPAELANASDLVVTATVTSVTSVGIMDEGEDLYPSEYFRVEAHIDDTIHGSSVLSSVAFAWEGFVTDGEQRTGRIALQGISMPDVGDQLLLFLEPEQTSRATLFDLGESAWALNTLDGVLWIDHSRLDTSLEGTGRPAHELWGLTVAEATALLDA